MEANRNFVNKIWNAGRFVIAAIEGIETYETRNTDIGKQVDKYTSKQAEKSEWTLADSWIWARLEQLVRDVERQIQNFQYGQAGQAIYDFIWNDFADWYVEVAKEQLKNAATKARTVDTLARVFDISLKLLHPFIPFVTEELWGHLRRAVLDSGALHIFDDSPNALIVAKWPEPRPLEGWEEARIAEFELIQEIVRSIRNLRAEKNVAHSKRIPANIAAGTKTDLLKDQTNVIASLAGLSEAELSITETLQEKPKDAAALVVGSVEIYLPLAGMVDLANEKARLEKELKEAESHIQRLENLLGGDFANKAPAALVQKEREKLAGYKDTAEKIKAQLK